MMIIDNVQDFKKKIKSLPGSIGLVPTMGALHAGHAELIKKSLKENNHTVVSIFVNPAQFNNPDDLKNYPKRLAEDLEVLKDLKVDFVFTPNEKEIYSDQYRYQVNEKLFSKSLCGKDRPGHFEGVLTICLKLFNLSKANRAYFGKKDYQQYLLIKDMAQAFFLDIEIIGVDTVRENDGLAMSSRNLRLSENARSLAPIIYKTLKENYSLAEARRILEQKGFEVDYLEQVKDRKFVAVKIEDVRLIDNVVT